MAAYTDIDSARYIAFTSFKKDGTPVNTPVWVVPFEDGYAFTTSDTSFKVKRIQRNPNVTVAASNARGRVADGTTVHHGAAVVLSSDQTNLVIAAIQKKYRIGWMLLRSWEVVSGVFSRAQRDVGNAAIKVILRDE